jgi:hypothetical protein
MPLPRSIGHARHGRPPHGYGYGVEMDGRGKTGGSSAGAPLERPGDDEPPAPRDRLILGYLQTGERLVARHDDAAFRFDTAEDPAPGPARHGTIYVTSKRVILRTGDRPPDLWDVGLDAIVEMTVASDVVLLVNVGGGKGLAIEVALPSTVRSEIAAANSSRRTEEAARRRRGAGPRAAR